MIFSAKRFFQFGIIQVYDQYELRWENWAEIKCLIQSESYLLICELAGDNILDVGFVYIPTGVAITPAGIFKIGDCDCQHSGVIVFK